MLDTQALFSIAPQIKNKKLMLSFNWLKLQPIKEQKKNWMYTDDMHTRSDHCLHPHSASHPSIHPHMNIFDQFLCWKCVSHLTVPCRANLESVRKFRNRCLMICNVECVALLRIHGSFVFDSICFYICLRRFFMLIFIRLLLLLLSANNNALNFAHF